MEVSWPARESADLSSSRFELPPLLPPCVRRAPDQRSPHDRGDGRRQFRDFVRCASRNFERIDALVLGFLNALVSGRGDEACRLLTRSELERLGGEGCPARLEAAAEEVARREPIIWSGSLGSPPLRADMVLRLRDPRRLVVVYIHPERRRWRLFDVRELVG
jgi:hypothetical protein